MKIVAFTILSFATVLLAGCGGAPPGAAVGTPSPTKGKVTFADGSVLKGGIVDFHPVTFEDGGKLRYQGSGLVNDKGEYVAGFNGDGKGLVPGEYIVTVSKRDIEIRGSNTSRIPKAYLEKSTSPLKVTIQSSDNTYDIVLK
ncbi:hypothetical protein KIH39_25355 [Telmatocola sphagniphila]|uniref:Carboxypeptidase regulatory-like domain-containing protein n=1 Tax=Telmatocola sphagniphila TaxID=1123043 RepID=A0A8E6EXY5_9BACT|nr:hypothetical protein [Telmatocola sphagniphila]QVL32123.1 hypothetical protein KIH39_25355 [Telmatocola sphagniphila]